MDALINGELAIALPEGFDAMSDEQLEQSFVGGNGNLKGFWDKERHIIVVITWNESSKFWVKLTNPKALVKRVEKHMAQTYKRDGYRREGFFEAKIAAQEARGVRFDCTMQGVSHSAETIVFLRDVCCYTMYYYTHSELSAANGQIRDQIYASMRFKDATR